MKNWFVTRRNVNYSYFESPRGEQHPSAYSSVRCRNCLMFMRSKAKFVDSLPDGND